MNILLVPNQCQSLHPVKLPNPKEGTLDLYYYDENNLAIYEIIKFNDQYRSWFLDNHFCRDGHFDMLTKVDPLFIFVSILEKFASKQFRTLDDICATYAETASDNNSIRLDYALSPNINWDNICETKQLDNELYLRYSESCTLKWLEKKLSKIKGHLKCNNIAGDPYEMMDSYLSKSISIKFKNYIRENPNKEKL